MKIQFINKSRLLFTGLLSFSLLFNSCKKDFEKINNDPNNPKDVPNSFYLAGAQRGLMDNTTDVWFGGQVGNQLAQYWSSNQYSSESRYQFRTPLTNVYWGLFYAGGINDENLNVGGLIELQRIIDNCKTNPGPSSAYGFPDNQIAVATTLRVWLYQYMTDMWGDIPYSEALNPEKTRAPKYDRQADIYSGLLSEINQAISLINTSEDGPVGDLIYSGDMSLWSKFANSLKMRLAIRLADRDNTTAQAAFTDAVAGAFTSNADNALMLYGSSATSSNPIFYNYAIDIRNDYCLSSTFKDALDSVSGSATHNVIDPRLSCWFALPTANNVWVGETYGLNEANGAATPNSSISQRSSLVLSATFPGIYMAYSEVEFMLAEAVERGWGVAGSAQSHYDAGVTSSIEYWTDLNSTPATPAEITAYLAQPIVDYTNAASGGNWMQKIGRQKWISLFNQGIQGWTEWRRLDFGILQLPVDGLLEGNGIPMRMKYALDEQTLNSGNYNSAVASQGADLQDTKVWWDKN